MRIIGIDFTSAPSRRKPITCLDCTFDGRVLRAGALEGWPSFAGFEAALRRPGPWVAGIDFPFGQSRKLVETIGWPATWCGYVAHAETLGRDGFRAALDAYRKPRPPGDKEHRRQTDIAAGAISPQKLHGVPVALMFLEGAPRLLRSGVAIPRLRQGDPARVAVEAYPGLLARQIIGRRSYKSDDRRSETPARCEARRDLLARLRDGAARERYGFDIEAPDVLCNDLCDDPAGDRLDALLCAIQAAWAARHRARGYGAPPHTDPLEGWIADPSLDTRSAPSRPPAARRGS